MHRSVRTSLALAAALLTFSGCAADDPAPDWGAPAEAFFADWSDAWAGADPFDIPRFYHPDVAIILAEDYRSLTLNAGYLGTSLGGEGRVWLSNWISNQYEPRQRSLVGLFFGSSEAVAVTLIPEIDTAMAVAAELDGTLITEYTDLRWRHAHLEGGAPDPRLDWLDELVAEHLAGWSDQANGAVATLYEQDATIASFPTGAVPLGKALNTTEFDLTDATVVTIGPGDRIGPATFVGPDRAAFVVTAMIDDDCPAEFVVNLTLENQLITSERRLPTAETMRRCHTGDALEGWWNGLNSPPPVGEQITGVLVGTEIEIYNGTPDLERFLEWGLGRFTALGMDAPTLGSATFAPVPSCASAPGVVTDRGAGGADLTLCTDAYQACLPDRAACTDFRASDRLGMLHELGHAWLIENLTPGEEAAFVELRGLSIWREGGTPWHSRGAEQAAEILAWGLMEKPPQLVRIGDPPCEQIAAGYRLLTGGPPPHDCGG